MLHQIKLLYKKNHNPAINCFFCPILSKQNTNKFIYETLIRKEMMNGKQLIEMATYLRNTRINWKIVYGKVLQLTKDTYIV